MVDSLLWMVTDRDCRSAARYCTTKDRAHPGVVRHSRNRGTSHEVLGSQEVTRAMSLAPIIKLSALAGCLFMAAGCAPHTLLRSRVVEQVPPGKYAVSISEDPTGSRQFSAVLFETTRAMVTLDLPRMRHVGTARPDDYGYLLKTGFVVHEVRGADGAVAGYVMAPGRAHVMVWEREPRGGVVVTVTGLSSVPESGAGGGGGGGGSM
jgi:hypothetical protein